MTRFGSKLIAAAKEGARIGVTRKIAMAICQERCAFKGEPACWKMKDDKGKALPWPAPACNDPGCMALAGAVLGRRDLDFAAEE